MKKATIRMDIFLPDNFMVGDCEKCPFRDVHEREVSYQTYERRVECHLGRKPFNCPIHICIPDQ